MKSRSAIIAIVSVGLVISVVAVSVTSVENTHENKIRVAFFPNIGHAIPIIGLEKGIFANSLGNETKIETKLFDSGPQVIESLFANSIDVAYVGPGPAINGYLKSDNGNVKILAGAASGGASFIVHPNSEINSASDFSGKRIAAPQIGNTQDISLRHYLSENGLKPAEKGGTVVILNIQNPDIYTLFTKAEIDGAWVPEPWATIFVQELNGKRLFHEEELWAKNEFASVLLIAREGFVKENPQVVSKWLDAHKETVNFINENPTDTRIIFNQFMKDTMGRSFSDSVIDESLSNLVITSDPIKESIFLFAERADSLGYLGRNGYNLDGIFFDLDSFSSMMEIEYYGKA